MESIRDDAAHNLRSSRQYFPQISKRWMNYVRPFGQIGLFLLPAQNRTPTKERKAGSSKHPTLHLLTLREPEETQPESIDRGRSGENQPQAIAVASNNGPACSSTHAREPSPDRIRCAGVHSIV
jgi:hypothetical protein